MQSTSEPSAMTGLPDPQRAVHAVGIPATPRSILKPFCSRMPVRYFVVSYSWKPSSAKLNTVSFIFWMFSPIASTSMPTFCLYCVSCGLAVGADAAGGVCGACAPSEMVAMTAADTVTNFTMRINISWLARLKPSRSVSTPDLTCLLRLFGGRILDAELLEVILVLARVVVVLLHLRPVFLHPLLVQPDRRRVRWTDQRHVLRG